MKTPTPQTPIDPIDSDTDDLQKETSALVTAKAGVFGHNADLGPH
jgi:hypothetical protein